jgi:hypothetical protein
MDPATSASVKQTLSALNKVNIQSMLHSDSGYRVNINDNWNEISLKHRKQNFCNSVIFSVKNNCYMEHKYKDQ